MIPEEKMPAVHRALQQAFKTHAIEDIQRPQGGLSTALVFRIVVRGRPYFLRIMMRADERWDPARHFAAMEAAAAAGLAPHIHYASVEDLILITDFVMARPFPADIGLRVARNIRALHALPPFAKTIHYFTVMDGLVGRFQAARLLPEDLTAEFFRIYDQVARVYPRHETGYVSSHNDLKAQNVLFDGERIYFVDWEAAFLNDPYVDLSIAANFFLPDGAEGAYLAAYFGRAATGQELARFYLMRQAMHAFYASFLLLSIAPATTIQPNLGAPAFRRFHSQLISGEVSLTTPQEKEQFGKVHLNRLLEHGQSARFAEALAQLS